MPRDDEPIRDLYDERPLKPRKPPKALRRLQKQFTYDKQLKAFRQVFSREPASDDELDAFVEQYLLEIYNSGADEI